MSIVRNLIVWNSEERSTNVFHEMLETAQATGAAVPIGLLFYALRAGGLLAAMLTALPVWSGIDPLLVLSKNKGDSIRLRP